MKYYSYILKSLKDNSHYYGSTEKLKDRVKTHNAGKVKFTKGTFHINFIFMNPLKHERKRLLGKDSISQLMAISG